LYNTWGRFSNTVKGDFEGGYTGSQNLDADPLFAQGYELQSSSPCKNKGNSSALPQDVADLDWDGVTGEPIPFDLCGNPRKSDFIVDIGAYEIPANGAQ